MVERLLGGVHERLGHGAAGVVHHDVDAAELVHRRVHERAHGLTGAEVARHHDGPTAERLDLGGHLAEAGPSVRAPITTSAPTSAKAVAMRAPMPRPAAVTIATFPSSRNRFWIIGWLPFGRRPTAGRRASATLWPPDPAVLSGPDRSRVRARRAEEAMDEPAFRAATLGGRQRGWGRGDRRRQGTREPIDLTSLYARAAEA